MDDDELSRRAREGDRDAFAELVTATQDDLYTMALRLLDDPAMAADVVQETFLRAYLNHHRLRGPARPWLFRIAINCSRDVLRSRRRRPTTPLEDRRGNVIELPDGSAPPETRALRMEEGRRIREALASLPEDYRVAVVLRDVNELSYEEAAAVLGVPVGTVRSRISRGRQRLSEALRRSEDAGDAREGRA